HPPTHYISAASAGYFAAILDWARAAVDEDSERTVRHIIGVPEIAGTPDPVMLDWVRDHHAETAGLLNYEVNILRWSTGADGQNMALIDDSAAFLAFSGGSRQKLNGSSVKGPTFESYYAAYFDQPWHGLVTTQTYLDQVGGCAARGRHAPPPSTSPPPRSAVVVRRTGAGRARPRSAVSGGPGLPPRRG